MATITAQTFVDMALEQAEIPNSITAKNSFNPFVYAEEETHFVRDHLNPIQYDQLHDFLDTLNDGGVTLSYSQEHYMTLTASLRNLIDSSPSLFILI